MLRSTYLRRRILPAVALCAAAGGASAQTIVNGGFEDPAFADNAWHFVYTTGTQLTGWSQHATNGTVLFKGGYMPVAEGQQAVQLEAPGDWISQSFATVAGEHYQLSFELSAYGTGRPWCPCTSIVEVGIDSTWTTFSGSSEGYSFETLAFTAGSDSTTLTFRNPAEPSAYGNYPQLDDVSVVQLWNETPLRIAAPVPEPETYALLAGGLVLLRWRTARRSGAVRE